MLHPSYSDLMKIINKRLAKEKKLSSRYSVVIASAKRARQIIAGEESLAVEEFTKPLSIAVNELYEGKIIITAN